MSRIVVIGATGHVGGYLVPRLVRAGHDVIAVSRGRREPYQADDAWRSVTRVELDRETEDATGSFAPTIAALGADIVVDMMCFTEDSARQLVDALRGTTGFLLSAGTIWVHGPATAVPTRESDERFPIGGYGTAKAEIEKFLLAESRGGGLPATVLHPGHITGPGWPMVNAQGNFDLRVWGTLSTGEPLTLPNLGLETVHHVHADDVAQAFEKAIEQQDATAGNSYHVVSERAMTLRGIAETAAAWFGQEANLNYRPLEDFLAELAPEHADASRDHIIRSPSMSIDAARADFGYAPNYTSAAAIADGLRWLIADGQLDTGGRPLQA
ncbi:nucleoside-diphosphate-sugar epimerase [Okibacterium sp. HSC-33S16]|uniref:NAD-dependent epimerase/dehydratase family protein n=1 Tax=Okibacterium sp. HSC-33S16 TaxID=2910965 RepID=UPI00209DBBE8|nr:NAD-dependent epimerase/dehydratase family protein [Okibacterium sp. HSC-33S16]MCP2032479.1 nucleoside-diphosphate-sugar epimerase [Okibacterium sp. HSC-33S16]